MTMNDAKITRSTFFDEEDEEEEERKRPSSLDTVQHLPSLSWRLDPLESFSDWKIEVIVKDEEGEEDRHDDTSSTSDEIFGGNKISEHAVSSTSYKMRKTETPENTTTTPTSVGAFATDVSTSNAFNTIAKTPAVSVDDDARVGACPLIYEYHVHKCILAVGRKRSEYFLRLFDSIRTNATTTTANTATSRFVLPRSVAETMPALLDYLYSNDDDVNSNRSSSGDNDFKSDNNTNNSSERQSRRVRNATVVALYYLAEVLEMPMLKWEIFTFIQKDLTILNAHQYVKHAIKLSCHTILHEVARFCSDHITQIPHNVDDDDGDFTMSAVSGTSSSASSSSSPRHNSCMMLHIPNPKLWLLILEGASNEHTEHKSLLFTSWWNRHVSRLIDDHLAHKDEDTLNTTATTSSTATATTMQKWWQRLTDQTHLPRVHHTIAKQLLSMEASVQSTWPDFSNQTRGSGDGPIMTSLQDRCIEALANHWHQLDVEDHHRDGSVIHFLSNQHPELLGAFCARSLSTAKRERHQKKGPQRATRLPSQGKSTKIASCNPETRRHPQNPPNHRLQQQPRRQLVQELDKKQSYDPPPESTAGEQHQKQNQQTTRQMPPVSHPYQRLHSRPPTSRRTTVVTIGAAAMDDETSSVTTGTSQSPLTDFWNDEYGHNNMNFRSSRFGTVVGPPYYNSNNNNIIIAGGPLATRTAHQQPPHVRHNQPPPASQRHYAATQYRYRRNVVPNAGGTLRDNYRDPCAFLPFMETVTTDI